MVPRDATVLTGWPEETVLHRKMSSKAKGARGTVRKRAFASLLVPFLACTSGLAGERPAQANSAVFLDQPNADACTSLQRMDFDLPPETPVSIGSTAALAKTASRPAICRVRGYVAPNTSFELALPSQGWNGKFFYAGCTGSCGMSGDTSWARECDYPLARGYACIISDMGHRSTTAVPGMEHCWCGSGPFAIDYIAAMENWVENDEAPDVLRAAHRGPSRTPDAEATFIHRFPVSAGRESAVRQLTT